MRSRRVSSKILETKKVFLFDLDGTLYLGSKIIAGAVELIAELRRREKKIFFFTNNSSRSDADYYHKLEKMGFEPQPGEVIMSTHSLIRYLKQKDRTKVFLLGTPAMAEMLAENGIRHTRENPEAVVVGFDKTLDYDKLKKACEFLEQKLPMIVTHPDLYCPTDYGREPDCGAFAKLLELVTEVKPSVVLGKPHPLMMKEALTRARCRPKDCVLVGDRLSTDILMARTAGVSSVLVLTGETTRAKLKTSKVKPTWTLRSVKDLMIG